MRIQTKLLQRNWSLLKRFSPFSTAIYQLYKPGYLFYTVSCNLDFGGGGGEGFSVLGISSKLAAESKDWIRLGLILFFSFKTKLLHKWWCVGHQKAHEAWLSVFVSLAVTHAQGESLAPCTMVSFSLFCSYQPYSFSQEELSHLLLSCCLM